jgi:hypothetical protein
MTSPVKVRRSRRVLGSGMSAGHAVNIAAVQTDSDVATRADKCMQHTFSTQATGGTILAGGVSALSAMLISRTRDYIF